MKCLGLNTSRKGQGWGETIWAPDVKVQGNRILKLEHCEVWRPSVKLEAFSRRLFGVDMLSKCLSVFLLGTQSTYSLSTSQPGLRNRANHKIGEPLGYEWAVVPWFKTIGDILDDGLCILGSSNLAIVTAVWDQNIQPVNLMLTLFLLFWNIWIIELYDNDRHRQKKNEKVLQLELKNSKWA